MQSTRKVEGQESRGESRSHRLSRRSRKALNSQPSTLNHAQRGFTLVELMVVVTIIAILIAILGATLAYMGTQAKEAATNATIKKIHGQLEQRLEAFDRQFGLIETSARVDPDYERAKNRVINNIPRRSSEEYRILVRKELLRLNFPQSFADAGITAPSGHTAETESAEMLYYMLTKMKVGENPTVDAGEFLARETADTDGDGLLEFVDGWGQPLRFYRWPTRLFKSGGTSHDETIDHPNVALLIQGFSDSLVDTDQDDPVGVLDSVITSLPEWRPPNQEAGNFEDLFHTPYTFHVPLIVSAGPDGVLGLGEPYEKDVEDNDPNVIDYGYLAQPDTANLGGLTDNITNRNQRAGD